MLPKHTKLTWIMEILLKIAFYKCYTRKVADSKSFARVGLVDLLSATSVFLIVFKPGWPVSRILCPNRPIDRPGR